MNGYAIEFARSALREMETLPHAVVQRAYEAVDRLRLNPRPHGAIKLKGGGGTHRLRTGDYRVLYEIDDQLRRVVVTHVRPRDKAYD